MGALNKKLFKGKIGFHQKHLQKVERIFEKESIDYIIIQQQYDRLTPTGTRHRFVKKLRHFGGVNYEL